MEDSANIDAQSLRQSLQMLRTHLDPTAVEPLLEVLEALAEAPEDSDLLERLSDVFQGLGPLQGAVLTYAPTVGGLLSDDPFAGFD
jgi:hypothetical protein